VARGAYLVSALTHCAECHSPRGALGNIDRDQWLAGTDESPTGGTVPNITPDKKFGIGGWTDDQVLGVLTDGSTPDFDYVGGDMAEEMENTTSKLTDSDRKAILAYLKSVPAVAHEVKKKEAAK
jgi:mono/diheme cytochrome c family protein